jgi:hypothetical protein
MTAALTRIHVLSTSLEHVFEIDTRSELRELDYYISITI